MRYRAWAVLGLLLLGLSGSVGEAAPRRVPPRVRQRIQSKEAPGSSCGSTCPAGPTSPKGTCPRPASPASGGGRQGPVPGDRPAPRQATHGTRQFETVPMLALEVGPAALAELEAAFGVEVIAEDRLRSAARRQRPADRGRSRVGERLRRDRDRRRRARHRGRAAARVPHGQGGRGGLLLDEHPGPEPQRLPERPGCADRAQLGAAVHARGVLARDPRGRHRRGGRRRRRASAFSGVAKGAQLMAIQVFSRITSATHCGGCRALPRGLGVGHHQGPRARVRAARPAIRRRQPEPGRGAVHGALRCRVHKPIIDNLRSVGIATIVASGNSGSTDSIASPACVPTAMSVGSDRPDRRGLAVLERRPVPDPARAGGGGHLVGPGAGSSPRTARRWPPRTWPARGRCSGRPRRTRRWTRSWPPCVSTGVPVTEAIGGVTSPAIRVFQALAALATTP